MRGVIGILAAALAVAATEEASTAFGALDVVADRLRAAEPVPLRWDNVTGPPEWMGGNRPEARPLRGGPHEVRLGPGEYVTVQVPAHERLRIRPESGEARDAIDEIEVAISNGSGLLAVAVPYPSRDGRSFLVDPQSPVPLLVHLRRPGGSTGTFAVSLFVSRRDPLPGVVSYREVVPLGDRREVRLRGSGLAEPERFWEVACGESLDVRLPRGGRFCLEMRRRYPSTEARLGQGWRVAVDERRPGSAAPGPLARLEFLSTLETADVLRMDGRAVVVSRLEAGFFDVPGPGPCDVRLAFSAEVFVRLRRLDTERFLLPRWNDRLPEVPDGAGPAGNPWAAMSPWHLDEAALAIGLRDPASAPVDLLERSAVRLMRDNARREGGLLAANLMHAASLAWPDDPDRRARWLDFLGAGTHFRGSLPSGGAFGPVREGFFPVRRLRDAGGGSAWVAATTQHRESGLRGLARGAFVPLPAAGGALTWHLPPRSCFTTARIAVDRAGVATPIDLWVRLGRQPVRRLVVMPAADVSPERTQPALGEVSLATTPGGTLGAAFRQSGDNRPMIDAGHCEFLLPPDVDEIAVWGAPDSAGTRVSVARRTSGEFGLGEDEFRTLVAAVGGREAAMRRLLAFLSGKGDPSIDTDVRELENHWLPLRRFVRARHRWFVESVSDATSIDLPANWPAHVDLLVEEGEFLLAERLARFVFLRGEEEGGRDGRRAAWRRLETIASRHLDPAEAILNRCAALVEEPGIDHAAALCGLLRREGEHGLALALATLLPPDPATLDDQLAVAFANRWWAHFEETARSHPDDPRVACFEGRRRWLEGSEDEALARWREAGGRHGSELAEAVERSTAIQSALIEGSADGNVFREWAAWERDLPGERIWRPVGTGHVEAAPAGAATVQVVDRGSELEWIVADGSAPARFRFASPRRLRVECRPLHPSDSRSPLDGWISVTAPGLDRKLPVTGNFRTDGLAIVGGASRRPGMLVSDEFGLAGWNSVVAVRPHGFPVLVRVLQHEPEFPVGRLPVLGEETAAGWLASAAAGPDGSDHAAPGATFGSAVVVDAAGGIRDVVLGDPVNAFGDDGRAAVRRLLDTLAPVPQPLDRPDHRRALDEMVRRLWVRESTSGDAGPVITEAARDHQVASRFPEPAAVFARLVRGTGWAPLLTPVRGAGVRRIESAEWIPDDPGLRRRVELLPPLERHEQLVAGGDSLVASLTSARAQRLTVTLANEAVPFLPPHSVQAEIQLGDRPVEVITLAPRATPEVRSFDVAEGSTFIRVTASVSAPNHYLRVGIESDDESAGDALERDRRRDWFVATAGEPLEWTVRGPAWLRIDEWRHGIVESRFEFVDGGRGDVVVRPSGAEAEVLCRVHQRVVEPGKRHVPPVFREQGISPVDPPMAGPELPGVRPPSAVRFDDAFVLGRQEDGTWTLGAGFQRRRSIEEDDFGLLTPEEFFQGEATFRHFSESRRTYLRSTVLGRHRTDGDAVFGIEPNLQIRPRSHRLTYTIAGEAFVQGSDWSLAARATVSTKRRLTEQWSHLPTATVFARALSRNGLGDHPSEVDEDIYTPWKDDHRRGLRLSERLVFEPFEDTLFHLGGGLSTNEDFNVFDPDSVHYRVGAEQRLGAVGLTTDLSGYRFFADDDRSDSVWRHRLSVGVASEWWLPDQSRLETVASYTRFFEEEDNAFAIFARWHLGRDGGRLLRDFRPDEKTFGPIRIRRIPRAGNNGVSPEW